MVGSNNTVIVAFGNGANIEFAGSNNAITWTSADGRLCSLIPGLGVKFSVIVLAGPLFSPR
jgi:hypothetical protein